VGYAAGNGHRVLEHLYERPIVSVNEVRALIGASYPAANQLVERLVKIGVLHEFTGQARHRRFRYDPYVRLFDGPQDATVRPGLRAEPGREMKPSGMSCLWSAPQIRR
jgi:hypothetical protein